MRKHSPAVLFAFLLFSNLLSLLFSSLIIPSLLFPSHFFSPLSPSILISSFIFCPLFFPFRDLALAAIGKQIRALEADCKKEEETQVIESTL